MIEVYPTAAFNGLDLWVRDGINLVEWFATEPKSYGFIADDGQIEHFQLRFLERLRVSENYGTRHTRFRKLSAWPYPDLWDAFGGAITTAMFCSGLAEKVELDTAKDEGSIVVPMRLDRLTATLGK